MKIPGTCLSADELVSYIVGQITDQEKKHVESHLIACFACRQEAKELQEAWELIPYHMDEVAVPADLKQEVMSSIFPADAPVRESGWKKRLARVFAFNPHWMSAALGLFLIIAFAYNMSLRHELAQLQQQSLLPSQVLQEYALKPTADTPPQAQGKAWLYTQGEVKKLVFQVQGLTCTDGPEAYQVWLIHEGKRKSAGVFRVDENGNGFMTYEMGKDQVAFEAIGITLEPDAAGNKPRGKKVLGT
ncbi:anti-sigma factor [Brevibacillus fluminis]|uniref:Regulator of SigK n=1 Tax=Brevibacillus fluminis TaxID=511487 RepID=A0A3M8D7T7_9BACL|nr:anti-sigma factor [Brevibacillus fluminis]RNB83325.1 anti-sigma factor [Brevibacillus fluminis]